MKKTKTVTVNSAKDYSSFLVHGLAAAGILAGVTLAVGSPVISAIAIGTTFALRGVVLPYVKKAFDGALPDAEDGKPPAEIKAPASTRDDLERLMWRTKKSFSRDGKVRVSGRSPEFEAKLNRAFDRLGEFSKKLGLPEMPSFHVLDSEGYRSSAQKPAAEKSVLQGEIKDYLRTEFNRVANAAAFSYEKKRVIVTEPLAQKLSDRELDAVNGHELGHIAARHNLKSTIISYLTSPARMTASLFSLAVFVASWKNAGIYLGGGVIGGMLANCYGALRRLDAENDKSDKAELKRVKSLFNKAAVAGLGVAFGAPDVVLAVGLSFATGQATMLLNRSYSRRNEFQADRIAAQVTGDPMALASGLDKVREYNRSVREGLFGEGKSKPEEGKTWLSGLFDRAKSLYSTHPATERRRARLENMALSMGAPAP